MTPFPHRLVHGLGESEIDRPGEELLRAVDTPRSQQLLRANQTQQIALFAAQQVLSAFTAGRRQIGRLDFAATGVIRQYRGVLVIGMGGNHQDTAQYVEFIER